MAAAKASAAAAAAGATELGTVGADAIEQTLISIKEVFVYPAGPRKNQAGFKANDWDLEKPAFTCELKARSTEQAMFVQFWKESQLMCTSVAIPLLTVKKEKPLSAYLEPVLDSSRYFVVRAQTPDRRTVMIGFGFRNRTDAFDLTAALNDRIHRVQRLNDIDVGNAHAAKKAEDEPTLAPLPAVDYTLKDDIEIVFKAKTAPAGPAGAGGAQSPAAPAAASAKPKATASSGGSKGGLFALAPPPADSASAAGSSPSSSSATAKPSSAASAAAFADQLAALTLSGSGAKPASAAPATAAAADEDWSDFVGSK